MASVNIHEAKTQFSRLIARAEAGEEIVVARAGKPIARIVPMAAVQELPRAPGGLKITGEIPDSVWFEPFFSDEELDAFEGRKAAGT